MRVGIQCILVSLLLVFESYCADAQDANLLLEKVKAKMNQVQDYAARGTMKTDVIFIKVPIAPIESYYMKPEKFQITRKSGVSLLPKGGIGINLSALILTNDYSVIDAGEIIWQKVKLKVIKLIPLSDVSHIVLTTLYIDPANHLITKANTTTKENGTYELEMYYDRFKTYGLPDKVVFHFNTKDYKLPKGITFEYDDGTKAADLPKNKKGKVEIVYSSYTINKGLGAAAFSRK
jgi:hypothetical protein